MDYVVNWEVWKNKLGAVWLQEISEEGAQSANKDGMAFYAWASSSSNAQVAQIILKHIFKRILHIKAKIIYRFLKIVEDWRWLVGLQIENSTHLKFSGNENITV